jgi:hypothetical protein
MPEHPIPCGDNPLNGHTAVSGVSARRMGGLWPFANPLDTRCHTGLDEEKIENPLSTVNTILLLRIKYHM